VLRFPVVQVVYKGLTHTRSLSEADCWILVEGHFRDWKRYLMAQHFRMELNISQPLPRIEEAQRTEEGLLSDDDLGRKYPPASEEERALIANTRNRLSLWFS